MTGIARLHAFGGPENLKVEDAPSQQPGPCEARLCVEAASVTRDHFTFMSGQQFSGHGFVQSELPSRLGYEAAGVVDAVGEGVDRSWIVLERLADGRFVPAVAKTFPLEQTVDAYRYLESSEQIGRVVITIP